MFNAFRGMKPVSQLLFAAFVALVSVLAVLVIGTVLALPFLGINSLMESMNPATADSPQAIALLKYLQILQSIGLFVVPPLILAWLFEGNVAKYLQLNRTTKRQNYLLASALLVVMIPFINYIGELNSQMKLLESLSGVENWMRKAEDAAQALVEKFMKVETIYGLMFNIFMIAVIPAVGEELMFRGVVQKIFTTMTKNYHWGIWISAFLFSAMHMQFYGFLPRMALGALFGYLLVWSGSMWVPILAHFINNAIGTLAYYLINNGTVSKDVEEWGVGSGQFHYVVISIIFSALLIYLIQRNRDETKMPVNREDSQASRID